jgi:diguanylate cyclase (GGDEF)-like protein
MENITTNVRENIGKGQSPGEWAETNDRLATESGLSILLLGSQQKTPLAISNNNSICAALQSSAGHKELCEKHCGAAFERAMRAGGIIKYKCHAGMNCFSMPVAIDGEKAMVVLGGRAFESLADYQSFTERVRVGDLEDIFSGELFQNVIFAESHDLDALARKIGNRAAQFEPVENTTPSHPVVEEPVRPRKIAEPTSGFVPRTDSEYLAATHELKDACAKVLNSLCEKNGLCSLALLLRDRTSLVAAGVLGSFKTRKFHIQMDLSDPRLLQAAKSSSSVTLVDGPEGFTPINPNIARRAGAADHMIEMFPLFVGEELKGALVVSEPNLSVARQRGIARYCREIALPLEFLRLRQELEQRVRFADYLQTFSESINAVDADEIYSSILKRSSDLLKSGRSSLLLLDEETNELEVKAALGPRADFAIDARIKSGDGVSGSVFRDGKPLCVADIETSDQRPAPEEHQYKTKSFISYPITVGKRKVGVLNVTDKFDGTSYDEVDLSVIEALVPQMAMALDRAEWKEKAAQFQLMSITDPLTGLLNRRYLEERLTEELKRSRRQSYAMCFMMIDIDDFKHYNDRNGHQAGDFALEMTGQCLRSTLRSADVASRYGGEEFCILLPQTTIGEACAIAERIRRRVEETPFPHGKSQPLGAVTITVGVSAFSSTLDSAASIIREADRQLYLAKRFGKNRVEPHEFLEAESD